LDLTGNVADPGLINFARDADSCLNTFQYRAGFNLSPWTRVALNAFYLHRDQDNDYDTDATLGGRSLVGITRLHQSLDITSDEVGAKLTLRPTSWFKTTLGYSLVGTE
jgi:hypothetical protein